MADAVVQFRERAVDLRDAYLRGLPSEATRDVYRRCVRQFDNFLGDRGLLSASRRDVEAWRATMEDLGRAPATIARALSAVTGLFEFAIDEGMITKNPAKRARRPKTPRVSPRQALSRSEARALLDTPDVGTLLGLRDQALLAVLLYQGLRISEAIALVVDDLHEEGGQRVATVRGKGGSVLRVPLAGRTSGALGEWIDAAGVAGDDPVFAPVDRSGNIVVGRRLTRCGAWDRVRTLGKRAGIKDGLYPHRLRHTAVSEALLAGVSLSEVQAFARHASPVTTQRYNSHLRSLDNPTAHVLASRLPE